MKTMQPIFYLPFRPVIISCSMSNLENPYLTSRSFLSREALGQQVRENAINSIIIYLKVHSCKKPVFTINIFQEKAAK